jgi:hypothetical protein
MRDQDWTKILAWPGYRVYRQEINEKAKTLKLWVRRKPGNQKLVCCGCGQKVPRIRGIYEREIRDLPCFEFQGISGKDDAFEGAVKAINHGWHSTADNPEG